MWTETFQRYKLDLEKAEEPEIKLPASTGSQKKQRNYRKTYISASLTMLKPLTVWIKTNCWKFLKRWEYQTTWPASCKTYRQVKKQQLILNMEKKNWFQIGKRAHQGCTLSPCLFNFYVKYIMRNASLYETQAGIRLLRDISITSDRQMTPPLWQKVKRN